jgi:hypothetical protein
MKRSFKRRHTQIRNHLNLKAQHHWNVNQDVGQHECPGAGLDLGDPDKDWQQAEVKWRDWHCNKLALCGEPIYKPITKYIT